MLGDKYLYPHKYLSLTYPKPSHFEGMKSVELFCPPLDRNRDWLPSPTWWQHPFQPFCLCTPASNSMCFISIGSLNGEHQPQRRSIAVPSRLPAGSQRDSAVNCFFLTPWAQDGFLGTMWTPEHSSAETLQVFQPLEFVTNSILQRIVNNCCKQMRCLC